MGFFDEFFKSINKAGAAIGNSPLNPGKQAIQAVQGVQQRSIDRGGPTSFFDQVGKVAQSTGDFAKEFGKFGYGYSEPGGIEQIIGHVGAQAIGKPFKTPILGEQQSYSDIFKEQGPVAGALTLGGDILGAKSGAKATGEVAQAGATAYKANPHLSSTSGKAGFFESFGLPKNEPKPNASVANANRITNEANTAKVVEDTLAGNREALRLDQPKALRQVVDYKSNNLPEGTTPDSTVTIYRAGVGDAVTPGDHVTLSEGQANKYATQRGGSKVIAQQVPLKDLVQSEGLKSEFVYSPKEPPTPKEPAVNRLITALGEAKTGVKQVEKAQSEALAQRTAIGSKVLETTPGEAGFAKAKKALQGPLVSEKPSTITTKLEQGDLDELYKNIQEHPTLRFFEKIRSFDALNKVFKGEIPQRNELSLLEDVFGPKFSEAVLANRTKGEKLRQLIVEAANVPRALNSSVDFSAPFRQGLVLTVKHPIKALAATKEMFKQAFSGKVHEQWLDDLKSSPEYGRMKDAGLYIADPKAISGGLNAKEEAFMTGMAEKIPIIGPLVKGSERAYVGYLNKIRVDVFNDLANKFEASGIDDSDTIKGLAKFVNAATGRGSLGTLEKIAPEMNTVFFAPRNMAARIQMLNPMWYKSLPAPVRKEAIKSAFAVIGTGMTILTLAKLAGAEVESDPRSTDFGKIKLGNLRYDIWGGFQQYARFGAQLLTGQKKTAEGGIVPTSRLDTAVNFGRTKLAPVPSSIVDIAEGKTYVGEPVTPGKIAEKNLVPFVVQDMISGYKESGVGGVLATTPSVFGVGSQSYTPKSSTVRTRAAGGSGLRKTTSRLHKGRTVKVAKTRLRKGRSVKAVKIKKVRVKKGKKI